MRPAKFKFLPALLLLGVVASASAQSPSVLDFKVTGSPVYPILDSGTGNLLDYDLANDRIDFAVGSTGTYDNPLFCFDFTDPGNAGVTLHATDANGHVVMDSVSLGSDLSYDLAGNLISMSPASSVQCFFKSTETDTSQSEVFGLYGEESTSNRQTVEGGLFRDSFAAYPELQIEYQSLQVNSGDFVDVNGATVYPGDDIAYEVIIRNVGNATADRLSLQEVFPASPAFTASLSEGIWSCEDNSTQLEVADFCPGTLVDGLYSGDGALRFKDLSLPANGGELRFTVFRTVSAGSEGNIPLFAGAVSGPGSAASSAAADVVLTVAEAPASMAFVQQPANTVVNEPISPAVTIELRDASGQRLVTDDTTPMDLYLWTSDESSATRIRNAAVPVDGLYTFDSIVIDTVGQYFLRADVDGLTSVDSLTFAVD